MNGADKQEMKPATSTEPLGIRLAARICGLDRPPPRASVTGFVISVGVDPNTLRVSKADDGVGFLDKAAAARRLLAVVDERMEELRKSAAHARRILRAEKTKGGL